MDLREMARTKALHLERFPLALPGEDRSYGGNAFYVERLPRSVWFANLRTMMPPSHWRQLSTYTIARASEVCEICGSNERLEAHERWHFDPANGIQKLIRLMCVCKLCHLSIHSGVAGALGLREDIERHIFRLTLWGKREMKQHFKEAGRRWEELTAVTWRQDVSIATATGATLYSRDEQWRRVQASKRRWAAQEERTCLTLDGMHYDFAEEIAKGFVVFYAMSDEETIGSLPVSTDLWYCLRNPADLSSATARLDLKTYLHAYKQPHGVSSDAELMAALQAYDGPKRLVLTDDVHMTEEMVLNGLPQGIIFSLG